MIDQQAESTRMALVAMLRLCADHLAALPAGEVDALLKGELELRLSVVAKKGKVKKSPAPTLDVGRMVDVTARLRSLDNRAAGEQLVREMAPTRAALEALARHLEVAVRKEDRLDDLVRKIIESTIGYRLSSAAIQGRTLGPNRHVSVDPLPAHTK